MYGCEWWTIKQMERKWIDSFEMRCWRRMLRIPWTAKRTNQFVLEKINQVIQIITKQKLSHFGHITRVEDNRLEKTIMIRMSEDKPTRQFFWPCMPTDRYKVCLNVVQLKQHRNISQWKLGITVCCAPLVIAAWLDVVKLDALYVRHRNTSEHRIWWLYLVEQKCSSCHPLLTLLAYQSMLLEDFILPQCNCFSCTWHFI